MKNGIRLAVLGAVVFFGLPATPGQADGPFSFYAIAPCRLVDTRLNGAVTGERGPILSTNVERKFPVQGACGVPAGAKAAALNVTAVAPTNQGRLTLYPSGIATPTTSNINFPPGTTALANGAIVPLADQAAQPNDIAVMAVVVGTGQVHLVLDVTGYFQ